MDVRRIVRGQFSLEPLKELPNSLVVTASARRCLLVGTLECWKKGTEGPEKGPSAIEVGRRWTNSGPELGPLLANVGQRR